jgi:hypothetical protein
MHGWLHPSRRAIATATLMASMACTALLPGCASLWPTPQTQALLAQTPADLPPRVLLAGTPFFDQADLQCGPASLAMVLDAAGVHVPLDVLSQAVFLPERGGSLQLEMLATPRRHGLVSTKLPQDLTSLLREVAAGHPVVVLLNLGLSIAPRWHYAVVIGHDLPASEVILHSGSTRAMRMPLYTFEHTWARSSHWAFVALPPGDLPRTAHEADAAEALASFERGNPAAMAVQGYQAALARWPDNLVLGLGLGNATYALGQWHEAAAAFERVATRHQSAAAWNNLAMARWKLGDRAGARHAAEQAVQRAQAAEPRWLDAARATLVEVNAVDLMP